MRSASNDLIISPFLSSLLIWWGPLPMILLFLLFFRPCLFDEVRFQWSYYFSFSFVPAYLMRSLPMILLFLLFFRPCLFDEVRFQWSYYFSFSFVPAYLMRSASNDLIISPFLSSLLIWWGPLPMILLFLLFFRPCLFDEVRFQWSYYFSFSFVPAYLMRSASNDLIISPFLSSLLIWWGPLPMILLFLLFFRPCLFDEVRFQWSYYFSISTVFSIWHIFSLQNSFPISLAVYSFWLYQYSLFCKQLDVHFKN